MGSVGPEFNSRRSHFSRRNARKSDASAAVIETVTRGRGRHRDRTATPAGSGRAARERPRGGCRQGDSAKKLQRPTPTIVRKSPVEADETGVKTRPLVSSKIILDPYIT